MITILVTARQRFGHAGKTLESVRQNTSMPYKLIYIEEWLTGAQAKAKAIPLVDTEYCVFLDNDMLVSPGWLEALVKCAEETGAWAVGPLYLEAMEGQPPSAIHMAGGFVSTHKGRLYEHQSLCRANLSFVSDVLRREVDYMEFHCLLSRREALAGLDATLLSGPDHIDYCSKVWEHGAVYIEPRASVTYVMPNPLAESDRAFYNWIWNHEEDKRGLQRFFNKWGVQDGVEFTKNHTNCAEFHRSLGRDYGDNTDTLSNARV